MKGVFQEGKSMCKALVLKLAGRYVVSGQMMGGLVGHDKEFGFYLGYEGKPTEH